MRRRHDAPCAGPLWPRIPRRAILSTMKLPVTLERDETGVVVAECPAIPGCVSQGTTEDEALANIREAIVGCLEVRADQTGLGQGSSSLDASPTYPRALSRAVVRASRQSNDPASGARSNFEMATEYALL